MTERDDVTLKVGEEHLVPLETLMTAGYVWEPEVTGDDPIVTVSKRDPGSAGAGAAVGAGPAEVFAITALRPGSTVVRFTQQRPWDPSATAGEHVVAVNVG